MPKRKGRIRWGALTGALTTIAGLAVTILNHPDVVSATATKLGVSAVVLGAIIQSVTKTVVRKEDERR